MGALEFCFDSDLYRGDLGVQSRVEQFGVWLNSAVKASLFTNRRDPDAKAGGCWSDALYADSFGSLLWTKNRSKITPTLLVEIQQLCRDALTWLKAEGHIESFDVAVERAAAHAVAITVTLRQNNGETVNQQERYDFEESN